MKANDIVEIYQLPLSEEKSEGKARLLKLNHVDDMFECWTVKFIQDDFVCERKILKK